MSHDNPPLIAYFMSITHSSKAVAAQCLNKSKWKLDLALNLFYEQESHRHVSPVAPPIPSVQPRPKPIIIPSMIEFQRFIESFDLQMTMKFLENSSKMITLAMLYAKHERPNLSAHDFEHWQMHVKVDYTRLQTLLDHDMCAPSVWIEHFHDVLQGNISELVDCDYMFNINDSTHQQRSVY